jgi:hypothetical protein
MAGFVALQHQSRQNCPPASRTPDRMAWPSEISFTYSCFGSKYVLLCITYGCLNAFLYASLLPLWEGFDEPFHYGYVQELSDQQRLPQLGRSLLSQEVCRSLEIAPQSHIVKQNLPWVTTFDIYFRLTPEEIARRTRELRRTLPRGLNGACAGNYEAHQAPLAYVLLAPINVLLKDANLPQRVWYLRVVCAILSCISTAAALCLLASRLGVPAVVANTVIFLVLSSQMFYATTAHIANDWLAVPLMVLVFERLIALWNSPTYKTIIVLAVILGLGLLTKAYFLALVPYTMALLAVLRFRSRAPSRALVTFSVILIVLAGPWYTRNILLYDSVTGMQETTGGVPLSALAASAVQLPWIRSARELLLSSLWTGNNSASTFSQSTLMLVLAGYFAASTFCIYRFSCGRVTASQRVLLGGCIVFGFALVYSEALSFLYTGGRALSPSPWYVQPIAPVISTLLFSVLTNRRLLRIIAIWLIVLSTYVMSATYWIKLIPLYSGFPYGKATIGTLISWYSNVGLVADRLSTTAMKGPVLVLTLASAVVFVAFALALGLCMRWMDVPVSTVKCDGVCQAL